MKQNFKLTDYLDRSNLEVYEELLWMVAELLNTEVPVIIDHNLAAKVRETLTEEEKNTYEMSLCNILLSTDRVDLLFSSPTQQIVAALVAKGILK